MWNTQEDEIPFQHTPFGLLVSHLDMVKIVVSSAFRQHVVVVFLGEWYLEGEKWHMTYSTRPSLRREQNTHQDYWSSPAQYLESTILIYCTRLPRFFFGFFIIWLYEQTPINPFPGVQSRTTMFLIYTQARVLHNDDLTYEVTQITWCNLTNVNKQNKNQSSCWLPASITLNDAFTKTSYNHLGLVNRGSVWNMY